MAEADRRAKLSVWWLGVCLLCLVFGIASVIYGKWPVTIWCFLILAFSAFMAGLDAGISLQLGRDNGE
jgi:hypothetical protein